LSGSRVSHVSSCGGAMCVTVPRQESSGRRTILGVDSTGHCNIIQFLVEVLHVSEGEGLESCRR
jgi:hypothetical protein